MSYFKTADDFGGYWIKNIKWFKGHEGEDIFQCSVYKNGKRIGFFSQDSWGGSDKLTCQKKEDAEALCSFAKEFFNDQYFSPGTICRFMAEMQFNEELLEKKKTVSICEPSIGAGGMLLAFLQVIMGKNPEYMKKLSVCSINLDPICVKMTTLQIMANLLIHQQVLGKLLMFHGNSLDKPQNLSTFYHASTPLFMSLQKEEKHQISLKETVTTTEIEAPCPPLHFQKDNLAFST